MCFHTPSRFISPKLINLVRFQNTEALGPKVTRTFKKNFKISPHRTLRLSNGSKYYKVIFHVKIRYFGNFGFLRELFWGILCSDSLTEGSDDAFL